MNPLIPQASRPLRVAFMTTVGRNVGDEFIREGIRSLLNEVLPRYDAYYVCKHDLGTLSRGVYDEPEVLSDKFRESDVIVQAGAPVYWSNGRFKSYNCEWSQDLWFDRIFALGGNKLILNLGAGAGQKGEDDLGTLLSDSELAEFARRAGRACDWTTVRDPLAASYLKCIGVDHDLMPCPAFFAARRAAGAAAPAPMDDVLAVNFMELAGHFRLKPQTDAAQWRRVIDQVLPRLRKRHRLLFIAHDKKEADFQQTLAGRGEDVFLSADYRDYLALYGRVKGIVANRVHGGVTVAGFGRPAVIVGNDCRIGIARPIDVAACDSADASADWVVRTLEEQFDAQDQVASRRLELREQSASRYVAKLRSLVAAHFGATRDTRAVA